VIGKMAVAGTLKKIVLKEDYRAAYGSNQTYRTYLHVLYTLYPEMGDIEKNICPFCRKRVKNIRTHLRPTTGSCGRMFRKILDTVVDIVCDARLNIAKTGDRYICISCRAVFRDVDSAVMHYVLSHMQLNSNVTNLLQ